MGAWYARIISWTDSRGEHLIKLGGIKEAIDHFIEDLLNEWLQNASMKI